MLGFCELALCPRVGSRSDRWRDRRYLPNVSAGSAKWVMTRPAISDSSRTDNTRIPRNRSTWDDIFDARPLSEIRVGGIVVPRHLWNRVMRRACVFRSVEYRVLKLEIGSREVSSTQELRPGESLHDVKATIQPLRRLLPKIERFCHWPVTVTLGQARLWSYKRDLAQCFSVTLLFALSSLLFGIVGPQFYSVYSIPSMSMFPTLDIGDAVLVKKMAADHIHAARGDIVFFRGPSLLLSMIEDAENAAHAQAADTTRMQPEEPTARQSAVVTARRAMSPVSIHRRDLFVKRVAAVPGDYVSIFDSTIYVNGVPVAPAAPGSVDCPCQRIPPGCLYVLGDHSTTSLDSRYWGLLREDHVVGRPVARLWPPSRFSGIH